MKQKLPGTSFFFCGKGFRAGIPAAGTYGVSAEKFSISLFRRREFAEMAAVFSMHTARPGASTCFGSEKSFACLFLPDLGHFFIVVKFQKNEPESGGEFKVSNVLKAMERTDFRKSALTKIRKSGHIPAIVYGSEMENRPIYLDGSQFLKTIKKVGKNGIITLDLDGKKKDVILSDYQEDPITKEIIHLDFRAIDMDTEIQTTVRVDLVGEAAGVKDGGVLQQPLFEIAVTGKPRQIPSAIEVDISGLQVNETLTVGDIKGNYSFTIDHEDDETIASILPPKQEEEISTGEKQSEAPPDNVEGRETKPEYETQK